MNIFETEFAAYISAKKSGQRKEAMKALNAFLEDCKKLDLDAERKVAADFFKQLDADDRAFAYSFPLNSQLLFPVLQAWRAEEPAESWIWRSFAEVASFREYLSTAQGDILCIEDDASLDDLPIRPEEAYKITGQLALLPDTPEKLQITGHFRRITGDYL